MKKNAFTLMELMVVIVIIGLIAGFSLPQYQRAVRKAHERDAIVQLTALHAANVMYFAKNNAYLPAAGSLAAINAGLNINIIANDMAFAYVRNTATTYTAQAFWDEPGAANDFRLVVSQTAIDNTVAPPNPCCSTSTPGQCPTRPTC